MGNPVFVALTKGLKKRSAVYCSHNYRAQIEKSVQLGKITVEKNLCSA